MKVKFFTASVMNLDRIEKEINDYCKDKEIVKVDMVQISDLVVAITLLRN